MRSSSLRKAALRVRTCVFIIKREMPFSPLSLHYECFLFFPVFVFSLIDQILNAYYFAGCIQDIDGR